MWIKFGQMLSTRRDLFPPHIADQLALLQDRVAPFEGKLAQQQIEKAMGGLPVAIVLLCWMGVTTPEDLRKKRPYVLVGAFVVGMLLTPPDVFSQTLLAIPMYCLFEVGVFFARFYTGKRLTRDDDAAAEAEAAEHREE